MTIENLELQEQIRESFQAGRINADQERSIRWITGKYGNEAGLHTLQYFEKMNSISAYFENQVKGFKIHEFYYHPNLPGSEKQKIAQALKEALAVLEAELKGGPGK